MISRPYCMKMMTINLQYSIVSWQLCLRGRFKFRTSTKLSEQKLRDIYTVFYVDLTAVNIVVAMSKALPTPASRATGSRLPAPSSVPRPALNKKSASGSNLGAMGPPTSAAPTGPVKRTRGSVDLEEGVAAATQQAKRSRAAATAPAPGMLGKTRSMAGGLHKVTSGRPATSSAAAKVARPLPNSMMSGRATMATASTAKRATTGVTATRAFNDRTNLGAKTNSTASGKGGKGVPGWDLKGRLEQMAAQMASTNERVAALESQNTDLKTHVEEKETVVAQNTQELDQLKSENAQLLAKAEALEKQLANAKESHEDDAKKFKRQIDDLEFDKSSLDRKIKALEGELSGKQEEICGLKTSVAQLTSAAAGVEAELKATKVHLDATKKLLETEKERTAELTQMNSRQSAEIEEHLERGRAFESERRKLHNTIQELKVNEEGSHTL